MTSRRVYRCPNCGTTRRSQREYVAHLLREAGSRGLTTADFQRLGAGTRFGARIEELRALGWEIDSHRVGPSSWRYTLIAAGRHHEPSSPRPHADGTPREWACTHLPCPSTFSGETITGPECPYGHEARVVTVIHGAGASA